MPGKLRMPDAVKGFMERYRKQAAAAARAAGPPPLSSDSSSEAVLDVAVQCTFPASDPISIDVAFHAARRRELSRPKRDA